jgi:UDP-glucose 4-epimerase
MKVVAVAGSSGFLGSNICRLLKDKGHKIIKIDISQGIDLCDPSIIHSIERIDAFIHLANLLFVPDSYKDPAKFYRVNYLTTLNALEICRKYDARMIYSSSYVYGTPKYLPVDENHPVAPFNPYAQTKVICEKMCEGYHRDFKIKVSIMRPFNLYGVGQKGQLLIPEIIGQLKEGKKIIQLKAASPRRDYVLIEDVAAAFVACLDDVEDYGVYNVCSGTSISVREITDIINKHLKEKVIFDFSELERPNEVNETVGSCKRLEAIGWKRSKSFEEGMVDILKAERLI